MKLYQYDHCPFCIRVRMVLYPLHPDFELITLPYDDIDTPTKLIGKKMLPILQFDDGTAIGESLDIIKTLQDQAGKQIVTEENLPENFNKPLKKLSAIVSGLVKPRLLQLDIGDWKSPGAKQYYMDKFTKKIGMSFDEAMQHSDKWASEANEILAWLDKKLADYDFKKETISMGDIFLFPRLRNMAAVSKLKLGANINKYIDYHCLRANVERYNVV